LWHGLSVVARSPDRATEADRRSPRTRRTPHGSLETFGRAGGHGQETVPQRRHGREAVPQRGGFDARHGPRNRMLTGGALPGGPAVGAGAALYGLRRRGLDRWLPAYLRDAGRRRDPRPDEEVHLLLCVADHYEPKQFRPPPHVTRARVERWVRDYPRQ